MQGKAHRDGPGALIYRVYRTGASCGRMSDDVLSQRHDVLSEWFELLPIFFIVLPVSLPELTQPPIAWEHSGYAC